MSAVASVLSADYSEDELDAVADAFGVPALGSGRLQAPPGSAVEAAILRATLATALRGLVARRALMVSGTMASPVTELLEPHGTLLGTFLGAQRIIAIERRDRGGLDRRVLMVRDGLVVEQRSLPGLAIVRMTARPRADPAALVSEALADGVHQPSPEGRTALELTAATLERSSDVLRDAGVDPRVVDVVHACRRRIRIIDTWIAGPRTERATVSWLDAGTLGWWRVEPDDNDPPAILTFSPCDAGEPAAMVGGGGATAA